LVFVIRTSPATSDPDLTAIDRIVIHTRSVEVIVSDTPTGSESKVTIDGRERTIELRNASRDVLVAQYQVPAGFLHQIRVFPKDVTIILKSGEVIALPLHGPQLPSWDQSGWKVVPVDDAPWSIAANEITGVRALFELDREVLHNNGVGYKLLPTVKGEQFAVNPPPGEPGVFLAQITVVFRPGTSRSQVDAINAGIGASVLIAPILGTAYRLKLPPTMSVQDAFPFYTGKPEVQGVLPAVNYALNDLSPNEGTQANHTTANLPAAWQTVQDASTLGLVGSHTVRVGIIDTGANIANPDLAGNIAINQGEIPAGLTVVDTDGDGVISFADLSDPANAAVRPADANMNGIVDGVDLLSDNRWANGVDDDDFDNDPTTLIDDLVGWDFFNNNNDPRGTTTATDCGPTGHGNCTASLVGAIGNNGTGIAGTAWAVSIVPIQASTGIGAVPDVTFLSAAMYLEALGVDIASISQGWHIASENANLSCASKKTQSTNDVPQADFDNGVTAGRNAFRVPPFVDGMGNVTSRVLYVFSAGNSSMNLADPNIIAVPKDLMQDVLGRNVLTVGSVDNTTTSSGFSDYGAPVVELWAPGNAWTAVTAAGGTSDCTGTSCACPVVAGTAALVLATHPALVGNPAGLHDRLTSTAAAGVDVRPGGCSSRESNQPLLDANAAVQP